MERHINTSSYKGQGIVTAYFVTRSDVEIKQRRK